jgi:hypothetical protein
MKHSRERDIEEATDSFGTLCKLGGLATQETGKLDCPTGIEPLLFVSKTF